MEQCNKCQAILKCKEGKYSSQVGTDKVIFTQIKTCDNKDCENKDVIMEIVEHEMN